MPRGRPRGSTTEATLKRATRRVKLSPESVKAVVAEGVASQLSTSTIASMAGVGSARVAQLRKHPEVKAAVVASWAELEEKRRRNLALLMDRVHEQLQTPEWPKAGEFVLRVEKSAAEAIAAQNAGAASTTVNIQNNSGDVSFEQMMARLAALERPA